MVDLKSDFCKIGSIKCLCIENKEMSVDKNKMEVFQQLRHLYVKLNNDLSSIQQSLDHPINSGYSQHSAEETMKIPLSDVRMLKDKVQAKTKELRDDTHFCEVVACCFDLINCNNEGLDKVLHHLEKYSVKPIRKACERTENVAVTSTQDREPTRETCNPAVTSSVALGTELPKAQVVPPASGFDCLPHMPNLADFGITESTYHHLDKARELLRQFHESKTTEVQGPSCRSPPSVSAAVTQGFNLLPGSSQDGMCLDKTSFNSVAQPDLKEGFTYQGSCRSLPALDLSTDEKELSSTFLCQSQTQWLKKTPLTQSSIDSFGSHSASGFTDARSVQKVLSLQTLLSPPKISEETKKALAFHALEKGKMVKMEITEPSLRFSTSSDHTTNILRELQSSKTHGSGIKVQASMAKRQDENLPPDQEVKRCYPAAKRSLKMGSKDSAEKSLFPLDPSQSLRNHRDETSRLKSVKASEFDFGSSESLCPQIKELSVEEYESYLPSNLRNLITLQQINKAIAKVNDVVLNRMLEGGSATLSSDDFKGVLNKNLFLKLMSKMNRLSERTGEHGTCLYDIVS